MTAQYRNKYSERPYRKSSAVKDRSEKGKGNPLQAEKQVTAKAYAVVGQVDGERFIDLDSIEWSPKMSEEKAKQRALNKKPRNSNAVTVGCALVKIEVVRMV
jgi:hypothetical protein